LPPKTLLQAPKRVGRLVEEAYDAVEKAGQAGNSGYVRGEYEGLLGVNREGELAFLARVVAELPDEVIAAISGVGVDVEGELQVDRKRRRQRSLDTWGRLEFAFWTPGAQPATSSEELTMESAVPTEGEKGR
jgi:hypothetical protein